MSARAMKETLAECLMTVRNLDPNDPFVVDCARGTLRDIFMYNAEKHATGYDRLLLKELQWALADMVAGRPVGNARMLLSAMCLRLADIEKKRARERDKTDKSHL